MLNIVAVQVGNYCGRGVEYVAKLFAGIDRWMPDVPYRAVCLTDDPSTLPDGVIARTVPVGLTGWWNKLALFKPGMFDLDDRNIYFDLDALPVGSLADIVSRVERFIAMRDPYHPERMNSSIMAWNAGDMDLIWTRWDQAGRPSFHPGGDQTWIEAMQPKADYWQDAVPGQVVSYKRDCWLQGKIPDDARVVVFHGKPRPHECVAPYIKAIWNKPAARCGCLGDYNGKTA